MEIKINSSLSQNIEDVIGKQNTVIIQNTEPTSPQENDLWIDTSEGESSSILNLIYPIGSIIIKDNNVNMTNWLGFTWEKVFDGKILIGQDLEDSDFETIGDTGGEKTHQLTIDEMPSHNHTASSRYDDANYNHGTIPTDYGGYSIPYDAGTIIRHQRFDNTGGSQSHNNMPPYQVVAYWKRVA